jgi:hypothetical protein
MPIDVGWRMLERENQMGGDSGRIYYVEVPSADLQRSAAFYREVFGWTIRTRDDGSIAFDDTSGHVSGTFTSSRNPAGDPGFCIFIGSDDIEADCAKVRAAGGTIVKEPDLSVVDIVARFRDPDGNQWGLHQYQPANMEATAS